MTVAEELHFGRAAARLGVAQPAASQLLARLERRLGVRLVRRSSRRVALTAEGELLLAQTRAALTAVDRILDVADGLGRGRDRLLRLGTMRGLGERLPRGLAALRQLLPRTEFVLVDGNAPAHADAVASGDLDAALVRGDCPVPGVRAIPVGDDHLSVVLPSAHPAALGSAVCVEQLAGLRLRLPSPTVDPALHALVLARCVEADVAPPRGRDVVSIEDTTLEIGLGAAAWTVVPDASASAGHRPAVAVRPLDPPLRLPIQLLAPSAHATPLATTLADAFRPPEMDEKWPSTPISDWLDTCPAP